MTGHSCAISGQMRIPAESACEIVHKAVPRNRLKRGDQEQTLALADSIAFGELDDGTPVIVCPNVDHTIRVVAIDTAQEVLAPLAAHDRLVFSVRYGRVDGRAMCVSAGGDRRVQLWDLSSGRPVADFIADAPVGCCAIDVEGRIVAAGDQSGAAHLLSIVTDGQAPA